MEVEGGGKSRRETAIENNEQLQELRVKHTQLSRIIRTNASSASSFSGELKPLLSSHSPEMLESSNYLSRGLMLCEHKVLLALATTRRNQHEHGARSESCSLIA